MSTWEVFQNEMSICGFKVGKNYVILDFKLFHYYYTSDNHVFFIMCTKPWKYLDTHLQYTLNFGQAIRNWIMDNVKVFVITTQIHGKIWTTMLQIRCHKKIMDMQSYILLHDIHNVMDMYISLEYKWPWYISTNIMF
jgi:hypothetical protein